MEPLTRKHIPEIDAAQPSGELGLQRYTMTPAAGCAEQWVERMLGTCCRPRREFRGAVLDGRLVGSSASYLHVDGANRRLEIRLCYLVHGGRTPNRRQRRANS